MTLSVNSLMGRRDFLAFGAASVGLGALMPRLSSAAAPSGRLAEISDMKQSGKLCKVVVLHLSGGAPQIDTFDPKPNAPEEIRSPYDAIQTSVSGVQFTSLFPKLAARAHKMTILRNVTHREGFHNKATTIINTGSVEVVPKNSSDERALPEEDSPLVYLSNNRFRRQGMGYVLLDNSFFAIPGAHQSNQATVVACDTSGNYAPPPGLERLVAKERHTSRRRLLDNLNSLRTSDANNLQLRRWDGLANAVENVIGGNFGSAFELRGVSDRDKARYGDNPLGRGLLVARELMEKADVPFIRINDGAWDMHGDSIFPGLAQLEKLFNGEMGYAKRLDKALAAFMDDMRIGSPDCETAVVVTTEFGRTPTIYNVFSEETGEEALGRNHWSDEFCTLIMSPNLETGVRDKKDGMIDAHVLAEATANAAGYCRVYRGNGERFPTVSGFEGDPKNLPIIG